MESNDDAMSWIDHRRPVADCRSSFSQVFTHEQLGGTVPNEPFDVFDKLDGSQGILYEADGEYEIATRGSFRGKQAEKATEILQQKYSHVTFEKHYTYLFEIVYPDNRIVIDYGDTEDLYLLAVIDTRSGLEQPLPDIGLTTVQH